MLFRTATGQIGGSQGSRVELTDRKIRASPPACVRRGMTLPRVGAEDAGVGELCSAPARGTASRPRYPPGSGRRLQTRSLFDLAQRQRLPAGDGPGALPRLRVVGDAGKPPAQLDRGREFPASSKTARIAAASASVTTNITRAWEGRQRPCKLILRSRNSHNEMVAEPQVPHEEAAASECSCQSGKKPRLSASCSALLHHMRAAMLCSSSPTASA